MHAIRNFLGLLILSLDRRIGEAMGNRRLMGFAVVAAAILAAFLIWDASAGATLPGKPVSMKAGAAW